MRRENRPVGVLIVLTFALSIAGAQESPNQAWANYDESADHNASGRAGQYTHALPVTPLRHADPGQFMGQSE